MTAVAVGAPRAVRAPRRLRPARPGLLPTVLVLVALACLWGAFSGLVLSGVVEHGRQSVLYAQLRQRLAEGTAPVGPTRPGTPVAVLDVPALGLRTVVVEGTAGEDLRSGPGHRRDTVLPGQPGVSVLYGRAVTSGHPFGRLSALSPGDTITVTTGLGVHRFAVKDVRRPGDPLPTALAPGQSRLVLGSVEGAGWRRGWAADTPVYVDAALQGTPAPAPTSLLPAVPAAEQLGSSDRRSLVYVVLWLQVLLAAALGLTWCASRLGAGRTWVFGTPLFVALMWATTSQALTLLPNVL